VTQGLRQRGEEPILDVRELTTVYAADSQLPVVAVCDVSLRLGGGEVLGVVGESGSGKSALALSIMGLIGAPGRIVSGTVVLKGRDLRQLTTREMDSVRGREVAMIFQDPMTSLDPVKRVGHQVAEAVRRHGRALDGRQVRRRVVELLEEVEIPNAARRADAYPHEYSGGMRQRVMIAIALANRPDVVIADEPTTALDVTTQAQIMELLHRRVTALGAAVIFITHNLGLVANFCDRVHVMYAGRLVESQEAQHLFAQPVHPYTEKLIACIPRVAEGPRAPLPFIPGSPPAGGAYETGCAFEPRCHVGHGDALCAAQLPEPVMLPHGGSAACHYAAARYAD